jgi:alcohol dehydrogenase class IV
MIFPEELFLPQKTIFKKGASTEIAKEVSDFGLKGLIVHGKSLERSCQKKRIIEGFSLPFKVEYFCRESGEPELSEISRVIKKAKALKADWIVGIGGGSVLDLAKAAAGLFNAEKEPAYYQEGGELEKRGIPFIAVPTTCGTGSEATPNSVIINKEKKIKLSIRDRSFLARKVILDVKLLKSLPQSVMTYAAMDAFVQGYESFVSKGATWFTESLALKAIELIDRNIINAYRAGAEESLSFLLLGSYLGGLALSSSRLGVIHGIAHPLGVLYDLPHGLICAVCFTPSIKLNRKSIGNKYEIISNILGMDFLKRVELLLKTFKIVSPFKGKKIIAKEKIIKETITSSSTLANPRTIKPKDIEFILKEIF